MGYSLQSDIPEKEKTNDIASGLWDSKHHGIPLLRGGGQMR